jgi:hypothetical protein
MSAQPQVVESLQRRITAKLEKIGINEKNASDVQIILGRAATPELVSAGVISENELKLSKYITQSIADAVETHEYKLGKPSVLVNPNWSVAGVRIFTEEAIVATVDGAGGMIDTTQLSESPVLVGSRLAGEIKPVRFAEFLNIVRIMELGRGGRVTDEEAVRRFGENRGAMEAALAMIRGPRRIMKNGAEYPLLSTEAELLLTALGGEGIYYGEKQLWTPEQTDLTPIAVAEKKLILPGESSAPQSDMEIRREFGSWMSFARLLAGKDPSGASEVLLTLPGNTDQEVLSLLRRIFVDTQKEGGPLTLHIELVSSAEEIKSIRSQYPNAKYGAFLSNKDLKNAAYQAEIRGGIPLGFAEDQAKNLQLDYGRHIPALVALVLLSAQEVPDVQRFKEQLFVKRSPILMMDNAALRSLLDVLDQAKQILTALNFLLKPDVTRTILIQKLRDLEAVASMA